MKLTDEQKIIKAAIASTMTEEEKALGAFLAAMHDCKLDGKKMREAMLGVLGITGDGRGEAAPKATMFHDAGAIAQCGYCQRYTLDPMALSDRQPICTCGNQHYWSGSFKPPTADSKWDGPAPATPQQQQAAPVQDGFVMVPREPTREMIHAGWVHHPSAWADHHLPKIWAAMIAAAPKVQDSSIQEQHDKIMGKL